MATEVINGGDLKVRSVVGASEKDIAHSTSYTLTITTDTREITNKDSGDVEEFDLKRTDITVSVDALLVYTSLNAMMAAHMAGTPVTLTLLDDDGADFAEGDFLISSLTVNAPDGEFANYSVEFEHADSFAFV